MFYSIAIDGPSGAGKSTISKAVAKKLGYTYIDTGAMYRAIGLKAKLLGLNPEKDFEKIAEMTNNTKIDITYSEDGQHIILDDEDVSGKIRTPEVSMLASSVSAIPEVRVNLVNLQRKMADSKNVIMDGRDIGTKVLPNASLKIFLTASPNERARRRHLELIEKGEKVTFEEVLEDVNKRDYNDTHRKASPLVQAEDAILLETDNLDFENSVFAVINLIKEKLL